MQKQQGKVLIANKYRVRQEIFGGMGVIYLCVDTEHDNLPVVLKTYKPQYNLDKNIRAQFLREAVIWVGIGWHPNIVQAYQAEYDHASHEIYLVLEMVPSTTGEKNPTLRSWLAPNTAISIDKTLKLMLEVARGMKYATTKVPGLTHCDLKPENIFIDPQGKACVSDFGLVSTPKEIFEDLTGAVHRYVNTPSRPVGTPRYMSPEQWRNRKVTVSSDIYSLGCICLEMLSGEYPIFGLPVKPIIEWHIRGEALNQLRKANLPHPITAFLAKCLDKDARSRYQSWEQVEAEILKLYDVLLNQRVQPEIVLFDVSQRAQIQMGETILSIGKAYLDIQEFQAAVKCFERARVIGKSQNFFRLVTQSEANIALAYFSLGKHERGSAHYRKAMAQQKWSGNHAFSDLINDYFDTIYYPPGDFTGSEKV